MAKGDAKVGWRGRGRLLNVPAPDGCERETEFLYRNSIHWTLLWAVQGLRIETDRHPPSTKVAAMGPPK